MSYCTCYFTVGPVSVPEDCPRGYYCPAGTGNGESYPCPPGSYGNVTGYTEEADCIPCTAGLYCEEPALTEPTGLCHAGFYCTGGASEPAPFDDMVRMK